jgi:hypothetical protein
MTIVKPFQRNWSRRRFFGGLALSLLGLSKSVQAMGQSGTFSARRLATGKQPASVERDSGLARWSWELMRRTSAPARMTANIISAASPELLDEPFVLWSGSGDIEPLLPTERRGIEAFIRLGGILIVDDAHPESGNFSRAARRELRRVVPESPVTTLESTHVIFKSFYLLKRPYGRVVGSERVEAIVRGSTAQVLFLPCDLLGALASKPDGSFRFETEPSGKRQRELSIRFAVNIAMYVLCSDYKDDQVHAPWLMRRRARWQP